MSTVESRSLLAITFYAGPALTEDWRRILDCLFPSQFLLSLWFVFSHSIYCSLCCSCCLVLFHLKVYFFARSLFYEWFIFVFYSLAYSLKIIFRPPWTHFCCVICEKMRAAAWKCQIRYLRVDLITKYWGLRNTPVYNRATAGIQSKRHGDMLSRCYIL